MEPARPRIVAFAGSLRKDSFNRKLLVHAVEGATAAGADVEMVGAERIVLPLYNGDLERDGRYPPEVEAWRATVSGCDGFLIASPEYNHGISGVLKNAIDWASRPPNAWSGKVAASFGASPGAAGTARGQLSLRACLMAVNVWVVPRTVLVAQARGAFDEAGRLTSERHVHELEALGRAVVLAIRSGVGLV
jgi:NAD(P)H-dependent FMN reductase